MDEKRLDIPLKTIESQGTWPAYLFNDYQKAIHILQNNGHIGGHRVLSVHNEILHLLLNEKINDDKLCYNALVVDLDTKVVTANISKNTAFLHVYSVTQMIPKIIIHEGSVKITNIQSSIR